MQAETNSAYPHFRALPLSVRALYTAVLLVLGMAYIFALIYVFATHAGRDGDAMSLSVQDLVLAYRGSAQGTVLEGALRGPMSRMLPPNDRMTVIAWISEGAEQSRFDAEVAQIFERRCQSCHDGSNPHLPNMSTFDGVLETVELNTGTDLFTLVRVSHIHLFGFTFIFFILGLIFSHARVKPVLLKVAVIVLPFAGTAIDVSSWYLTKIYESFAWVVMISGGVIGFCFAFMWLVSMYQLWIPLRGALRNTHEPG